MTFYRSMVADMSFVYLLTNTVNGKVYVGKSNDPKRRWISHRYEARKETPAYPLGRAIKKYGPDTFEVTILDETSTEEEAYHSEVAWIEKLASADPDFGYNLDGGGAGSTRATHSGRRHSEHVKEKIAKAHRGLKASAETRALLSAQRKGRYRSPEASERQAAKLRGRKQSPTHVSNRSEAIRKWWATRKVAVLAAAFLALFPGWSKAEDCSSPSSVCVEKDDLVSFLDLARGQKCRTENPPEVTSDPVTIVVDRSGRVFGSGTGAHPLKIHIKWCSYEIEAESQVSLLAAQRVEPDWGFRLRLKPTFGLLVPEAFRSDAEFHKALDGGLLIEPFYVYDANLNVYLGVRSFGLGLGYDITKNMTGYAGYSVTWGSWRPNLFLGVGFSLW
jgi:group I intron endonuclease